MWAPFLTVFILSLYFFLMPHFRGFINLFSDFLQHCNSWWALEHSSWFLLCFVYHRWHNNSCWKGSKWCVHKHCNMVYGFYYVQSTQKIVLITFVELAWAYDCVFCTYMHNAQVLRTSLRTTYTEYHQYSGTEGCKVMVTTYRMQCTWVFLAADPPCMHAVYTQQTPQ